MKDHEFRRPFQADFILDDVTGGVIRIRFGVVPTKTPLLYGDQIALTTDYNEESLQTTSRGCIGAKTTEKEINGVIAQEQTDTIDCSGASGSMLCFGKATSTVAHGILFQNFQERCFVHSAHEQEAEAPQALKAFNNMNATIKGGFILPEEMYELAEILFTPTGRQAASLPKTNFPSKFDTFGAAKDKIVPPSPPQLQK
ncbi:protein of unknown function [Taphrina deformans PYCC 5710]|uniref:Uncharacterized protein n=1 Tax=Taphrina deformans (strain PYCC 5710 / ATCC 11124 / CBS 356.35 / IMI 108563 / JCM 9778 / NBRC 8474) TaxID=1097556 RepID=R4XF59_TAPDE|nr:protein of unknown function [Taphrina deformans PYCC 5710]|eukprot:CCG84283.1 protein of unknown function [Taphrina deformans PYCC 5710]